MKREMRLHLARRTARKCLQAPTRAPPEGRQRLPIYVGHLLALAFVARRSHYASRPLAVFKLRDVLFDQLVNPCAFPIPRPGQLLDAFLGFVTRPCPKPFSTGAR